MQEQTPEMRSALREARRALREAEDMSRMLDERLPFDMDEALDGLEKAETPADVDAVMSPVMDALEAQIMDQGDGY